MATKIVVDEDGTQMVYDMLSALTTIARVLGLVR